MTEPVLTREAIQIAKAIAAARSHKRFRPLVTDAELDKALADIKAAMAVVDTWEELAKIGGEKVLDYIVSLGVSYLTGGGFGGLREAALLGIEPLMDYLKAEAAKVFKP